MGSPTTSKLDVCFALMRRYYINDIEMAEQPAFYAEYADELMRQLRVQPVLARSKLRLYLDYLKEDLGDTEVSALVKRGKAMRDLLADIDAGKR